VITLYDFIGTESGRHGAAGNKGPSRDAAEMTSVGGRLQDRTTREGTYYASQGSPVCMCIRPALQESQAICLCGARFEALSVLIGR
jgi:hypothetical protein